MQTQREAFRLIVYIRKVWLAVRFNCKLAFMLKNELAEKLAESDSSFGLQRGECSVNQTLSLEVPASALLTRCKKLRLIVMMISANGMVPAGFVTFSPHPRATYEQFELILPLERCEDSKAQIKFMHVLEDCSKTPRENSYIQQLAFKKEGIFNNAYDFQEISSKRLIASPSRLRLSLNKQRGSQVSAFTPAQYTRQERYSKLDNNSRLIPRKSQANHIQKLNLDSDYRYDETVQHIHPKQNDESDIGLQQHMTRDQLIKEHQEYWMEIIRMEEENEGLKQENERLKQQEVALRRSYEKVKEDYEADQQKIHAFVSQNQENSRTIRQLQAKIEEQKAIIQQKDDFEKDYFKLVQMLQEQLNSEKANGEQITHELENKHQEEISKLQEEIRKLEEAFQQSIRREQSLKQEYEKFIEEKDTTILKKNSLESQQKQHELEVAKETVLFLQSEIKKFQLSNAQLSQTNEQLTQNINTLQAINQDLNMKNAQLTQSYEQKNQQASLFQETVEQMDRRLTSEQTEKNNIEQSLSFQKKHNKELELIIEQHGEEIEHLKSKLNNRDRDLQIQRKDNQQKTEEINNYSRQIQYLKDQHEMFQLKLLQNEAIIASKNTKIKELAQLNEELMSKNRQITEKIATLENEFSMMSDYLNKEQNQKNKLVNILSTLEDNGRTYEQECKRLKKRKDELKKHLSILDNEVKSLQQQNDQKQAALAKAVAELKQHKESIEAKAEQTSNQIASLSTSLVTALSELDQERSKHANKDEQYQSSYNLNITSLTLKLSKLQKQNAECNRKIEQIQGQKNDILFKLQEKQKEINQLKAFTHDKLQQNLRLMKETQEIKKKLIELEENSTKMESSFRQDISFDSNSKFEEETNEPSTITGPQEIAKSDSKAEAKKKKKKR